MARKLNLSFQVERGVGNGIGGSIQRMTCAHTYSTNNDESLYKKWIFPMYGWLAGLWFNSLFQGLFLIWGVLKSLFIAFIRGYRPLYQHWANDSRIIVLRYAEMTLKLHGLLPILFVWVVSPISGFSPFSVQLFQLLPINVK